MKKVVLTGAMVAVLALTMGGFAAAQPEVPPTVIPAGPQTGAALVTLVDAITNWLFVIFLLIAVIFILLAAFQFLTGGGDPAGIAMARQKLIYAAVAIAIAVMSRGLPAVVRSIIGT